MIEDWRLATKRVLLRMPVQADATRLQSIASDPNVALTTASIPHPYPVNGAEEFITRVRERSGPDRRSLAITDRATDDLIGMIGFAGDDTSAELTYMIVPARWGQGFATEAGGALLHHLFNQRGYCSVTAAAMTANPGSERVLQKLGFEKTAEALREVALRDAIYLISHWQLSPDGPK